MEHNDVVAFAKSRGYVDAIYTGEWNGYDVYEPIAAKDKLTVVGLPYSILVKDGEIRSTTRDEVFKVLDHISK
jgi:hypothetical protein